MEIGNSQLELISKVKKYLSDGLLKKVNTYSSGICYFSSYGLTPGYAKLKLWNGGLKNILIAFKIFCRDILLISHLYNYQTFNEKTEKNNYKTIIVSWAKKKDFLPDGTFSDRYFKVRSDEINDSLWFLIYHDDLLPAKIKNNILIFKKSTERKKYNFFYLIVHVLKSITSSKFSLKKAFYKISWFTVFSSNVCDSFKKYIDENVKTIVMPYEGQPFQNEIFKISKTINKKIKNIGYIHSFPVGLPTNFVFRDGSPDELIVNGDDQVYCFANHLNWDYDSIKILPSLRFSEKSENMAGFIFLPINIKSSNEIIKSFKDLLIHHRQTDISNFIIKNHPLAENSKIHLDLINKIKNLLSKYNNHHSTTKNESNFSIFIGATGSIIEALERGVETVHICENPIFESYNNKLWPSIKAEKISSNIFRYKLLKKGNLIKFGDDNKILIKSYFQQ